MDVPRLMSLGLFRRRTPASPLAALRAASLGDAAYNKRDKSGPAIVTSGTLCGPNRLPTKGVKRTNRRSQPSSCETKAFFPR